MTLSKRFEKELSVWEKAIEKATDSIYGVLISHLYTEYLIDRYLKSKLPKDNGLTGKNGLSYSNKLKLVISLGEIDDQLADSLKKLNDIRNNCAHVFGHEITEKEVEKYGRTIGKDFKRITEQYPDVGTHGIAPITYFIVGQLISLVAQAEGWQ